MKKLIFLFTGFLVLITMISFQDNQQKPIPKKIALKNITFTHQTTASRFCNNPTNASFPESPATISINQTGTQPQISYDFMKSGNFGMHKVTIDYAYYDIDPIKKSFSIKEELKIDGCNQDPSQPDGAWLKGIRKFSFDFDLPKGNNYDIVVTKISVPPTVGVNQYFNENYHVKLENLRTNKSLSFTASPYTFQARPPGSYRCTIECTDLKAGATTPFGNPQPFNTENTFSILYNKL